MTETYAIYHQPQDGSINGEYIYDPAYKSQSFAEDIARRCNELDPSRIWEARKEINK